MVWMILYLIFQPIEAEGGRVAALGGVSENPNLEFAIHACSVAKRENADFILAIGGGSVIDTAKSVSVGYENPELLWDYYKGKAEPKGAVPIGTILTMAATASEANCTAVLSNECFRCQSDRQP